MTPEQTLDRVRLLSSGVLTRDPDATIVKVPNKPWLKPECITLQNKLMNLTEDYVSTHYAMKAALSMEGTFCPSLIPGLSKRSATSVCIRQARKGNLTRVKQGTSLVESTYKVTAEGKRTLRKLLGVNERL